VGNGAEDGEKRVGWEENCGSTVAQNKKKTLRF